LEAYTSHVLTVNLSDGRMGLTVDYPTNLASVRPSRRRRMVALPAYPIRRQLIQGLSVCIVPTSGSLPVAPLFVLLLDELNISPYRANQARSRGNLTAARSKITDFRNRVSAQTGRGGRSRVRYGRPPASGAVRPPLFHHFRFSEVDGKVEIRLHDHGFEF
jgi:hypothetical protein